MCILSLAQGKLSDDPKEITLQLFQQTVLQDKKFSSKLFYKLDQICGQFYIAAGRAFHNHFPERTSSLKRRQTL